MDLFCFHCVGFPSFVTSHEKGGSTVAAVPRPVGFLLASAAGYLCWRRPGGKHRVIHCLNHAFCMGDWCVRQWFFNQQVANQTSTWNLSDPLLKVSHGITERHLRYLPTSDIVANTAFLRFHLPEQNWRLQTKAFLKLFSVFKKKNESSTKMVSWCFTVESSTKTSGVKTVPNNFNQTWINDPVFVLLNIAVIYRCDPSAEASRCLHCRPLHDHCSRDARFDGKHGLILRIT